MGARVLDVGSGSGYLTAVLGALVLGGRERVGEGESEGESDGPPGGRGGLVVGVEHIEALRAMGEANTGKSEVGREWLGIGKVKFVLWDGRRGWREGGPWDAIVSLVDMSISPFFLFSPVSGRTGIGVLVLRKTLS